MSNRILAAIEYVLGDEEHDFSAADGFGSIRMPNKPEMWGWGRFRRATQNIREMGLAVARKALSRADLDPASIGCVITCDATAAETDRSSQDGTSSFLKALGLPAAYPFTIQTNGCDALLIGIATAANLLKPGQIEAVLVVAANKTPVGAARFQRYGIFSDGACACIVTIRERAGLEIVGTAFACETATMSSDAPFTSDLATEVRKRLLTENGYVPTDVKKVFSNNLFRPIVLLKEQEAGFQTEQIYTDNISRISHCYSCDPLINIRDFLENHHSSPGDLFVLTADAPGLRSSILLRTHS